MYILLPVVIFIWGLIFYKIINRDSSGEDYFLNENTGNIPLRNEPIANVAFELNLDYNDPFLGGSTIKSVLTNNNVTTIAESTPTQRVTWPNIQYSGCVQSKGSELAYLHVDGNTYLAGLEMLSCNIKVLNIYPDSIQLQFMNEKKWFTK